MSHAAETLAILPALGGVDVTGSDKARAAFAILIQAVLESPSNAQAVPADPLKCPNCSTDCMIERSPYCGDACKEEAAYVRRLRGALSEAVIADPERQALFGELFWRLLGGGYPGRQELITDRARKEVFTKANGKCSTCGAPAETMDHITTGCNRAINLRAVCHACSITIPFGETDFLSLETTAAKIELLASRISANAPIRASDDPENWDWRAFVNLRRNAIRGE